MWHYGNAHQFQSPGRPPAVAQSIHDLLVGMRGQPVGFLFPHPVRSEEPLYVPGFLEEVAASRLTLGLAAPLPRLEAKTSVEVEIPSGVQVLRFHTSLLDEVETGETRIQVGVPRRVETVQRRLFSRAALSVQVVFTRPLSGEPDHPILSGLGQTLDLSPGGLRMVTSVPLRRGDTLYLSFTTPDGRTFRGMDSLVTRCQADDRHRTVAVSFTNLPQALEEDLIAIVYRLLLRNPAPL